MPVISQIQLGKNGITDNFIKTLNDHFKRFENVKISVLKNAGRDREKIKNLKDQILEKLGKRYTARIIGFTIVVKRWRRAIR